MTTWRYVAVATGPGADRRRGEMTGATAGDVRRSLRRVGLQVIDIRPIRGGGATGLGRPSALRRVWHRHLRRRRQLVRGDLCDSLATMLESGVPILEAVATLIGSDRGTGDRSRVMLTEIHGRLQGGASFSEALDAHRDWFDPAQIAMLRMGQQRGELSDVLRHLAERSARGDELTRQLVGALTYPAIVSAVGLGVVLFLSVNTLPELARILGDAGLEVPALTRGVMAIGQGIIRHWMFIVLAAAAAAGLVGLGIGLADRHGVGAPDWVTRRTPRILRRLGIAALSVRLAELVRTGIPVSEAMVIVAPTVGPRALRRTIERAAERVERGHELSAALDDPDWFDAEYRRLVDIGLASGELDSVLERLGRRYERQAERLIDRLATLLEPAAILTLAVLVGTVVMAAMLPLIRLQEIIG
ncbi:MAG: type II secretion system F family protein [Phycisphaerales bacterium]